LRALRFGIAAWCDRIQGEDGVWQSVEKYLKKTADTDVSHGLCPECFQKELDGLDVTGGAEGSAGNVA
jgi:hypothetical protein